MSVFITSDLHFGHENLCRGLRNMSSKESDELIISNWNKIINKKDKVFILGDLTMEKPNIIMDYLNQLKGEKEIILGNHDYKSAKILIDNNIKVSGGCLYKGFWLSHIPIHESQLEFVRGNLHGHIHEPGNIEGYGEYNPKINLGVKYFNVNIEFNNYFPFNFENIIDYFLNLK